MLKIKDYIDLKELEKFGFVGESFQNGFLFRNCYVFRNDLQRNVIFVNFNTRLIELGFDFTKTDCGLSVLFDLIKADLIDKVV